MAQMMHPTRVLLIDNMGEEYDMTEHVSDINFETTFDAGDVRRSTLNIALADTMREILERAVESLLRRRPSGGTITGGATDTDPGGIQGYRPSMVIYDEAFIERMDQPDIYSTVLRHLEPGEYWTQDADGNTQHFTITGEPDDEYFTIDRDTDTTAAAQPVVAIDHPSCIRGDVEHQSPHCQCSGHIYATPVQAEIESDRIRATLMNREQVLAQPDREIHLFTQDPDEQARLCKTCGYWPEHHNHPHARSGPRFDCYCIECIPHASGLPDDPVMVPTDNDMEPHPHRHGWI